jgi:hypothetical protein
LPTGQAYGPGVGEPAQRVDDLDGGRAALA